MIADFGAKLVRYVASKKKRSIGSSTGAARYTRSLDMPFQPVIFADGQYAIFEDMRTDMKENTPTGAQLLHHGF